LLNGEPQPAERHIMAEHAYRACQGEELGLAAIAFFPS
jgi:hypothetical protein